MATDRTRNRATVKKATGVRKQGKAFAVPSRTPKGQRKKAMVGRINTSNDASDARSKRIGVKKGYGRKKVLTKTTDTRNATERMSSRSASTPVPQKLKAGQAKTNTAKKKSAATSARIRGGNSTSGMSGRAAGGGNFNKRRHSGFRL